MSAEHHVFRRKSSRARPYLPVMAGLVATLGVFVIIPLTQKLSEIGGKTMPPAPEFEIEAPDDFVLDEPPPPEPEPEPEPEDMPDEAMDLDLSLEVAGLSMGTDGGFLMKIPTFGMGGGDSPFGSGELDGPPTPIHKIPPTYPNSMLGRGIGGRVVIRCVVDVNGAVVSTKVQTSSNHSELDRAALNAVSRWKFKPGSRGGKKVKSVCNVPFNFEVRK
ncbi:MAG: energy transducer TonB [Luteolibacter sp.]